MTRAQARGIPSFGDPLTSMTPAQEAQELLLHMHRCLLSWICRASPDDREKFIATSNRVRGEAKTAELMAEAREMYVEMKKRGEM